MAQLALSFAQRAVTGIANVLVGGAITSLFSGDRVTGAELEKLHILQSTEGAAMPIVYGRVRIGGQIIWADQPIETRTQVQGGGKGGPRTSERTYTLNFAVGLSEGVIDGIGRVWADGKLLDSNLTQFRFHAGDEDQLPDSLIQVVEGVDRTPAFKGLAYVIFENFPLSQFGNRIPQLSFEVFRSPLEDIATTGLRKRLKGVTLLPSSGEFAYATKAVLADIGPGVVRAENINNSFGGTDILAALDDLQRTLPACDTVSLVVSWFGNDLRCEFCELRPGVELQNKVTIGHDWVVGGVSRTNAHLVSTIDERPAFGGTPSDTSILQAIAELKSRGFRVVFYPFFLMDIPADNTLPDPYGATQQSVYPWRGRITCNPASGQSGSPDKSSSIQSQIAPFFGAAAAQDFEVGDGTINFLGDEEWSLRRMILHYAHLCNLAGGVDAFLISSELRGMTQLRSSQDEYPMVSELTTLAQDVSSILPQVKISYAADWSEYFGHHPQDGSNDVYFHLDSLWSDPAVDFVGIDWYAPLSDWREGSGHADASQYSAIHNLDYLRANVEAGEGYDWFYQSSADRTAQIRTSITDGSHDKPWVFRYKDISNWWANNHFDRPAGVESGSASSWVPQSKPIWFTETGCPAVDKGANQPNVFFDPKSSESQLPYFSNGNRDDLIQRRYCEAILDYWQVGMPTNPTSNIYSGPMIDPANIQIWTWDARPFPDFPTRDLVWSDGANWQLGHWLNGRVGFSSLAAIISDLCKSANISDFSTTSVAGIVTGYTVRGGTSVRDALSPLAECYGFETSERFGTLHFTSVTQGQPVLSLPESALVESKDRTGVQIGIEDIEHLPTGVRIQFSDDAKDYQPAETSVRVENFDPNRLISFSVPLVADHIAMKKISSGVLARSRQKSNELRVILPPSHMALEVADVVRFDQAFIAGQWQIARIEERGRREVWLQSVEFVDNPSLGGAIAAVGAGQSVGIPSRPALLVLDIPLLAGENDRLGPRVAAFADPWIGSIEIRAGSDPRVRALLGRPALLGQVLTSIPAGGVDSRFDESTIIHLNLPGGNLLSITEPEVLDGQNSLAIQHSDGRWEVMQFQFVTLQGDGSWKLSRLLRGQSGTEGVMEVDVPVDAPVVLLDGSSQAASLNTHEFGAVLDWQTRFEGRAVNPDEEAVVSQTYVGRSRLPRKPVHLRAKTTGSGIDISWIRRTRIGGDNWHDPEVPLAETEEVYQFELYVSGMVALSEQLNLPVRHVSDLELTQLFPSGTPSQLDVAVSQISPEAGRGETNRQFLSL